MLFCPFAERSRIILKIKNIPHEIVNVDLKKKPEWFIDLYPAGKQSKFNIKTDNTIF